MSRFMYYDKVNVAYEYKVGLISKNQLMQHTILKE